MLTKFDLFDIVIICNYKFDIGGFNERWTTQKSANAPRLEEVRRARP